MELWSEPMMMMRLLICCVCVVKLCGAGYVRNVSCQDLLIEEEEQTVQLGMPQEQLMLTHAAL